MGCDIHSWAEQKKNDKWEAVKKAVFPNSFYNPESDYFKNEPACVVSPFDVRNYSMFGFLADVRNYSFVPVLVKPRGFPVDASEEVQKDYKDWNLDGHSASWILAKELLDFNYDGKFEDRRTMRNNDGSADSGKGNGILTTFRDFLGENYFDNLKALKELGDPENTRIVFWFDN